MFLHFFQLCPPQAGHHVTVAEVARALTLAASPSTSTTLQSILAMEEESILGLQTSEEMEATNEDIAEDLMELDDETHVEDGAEAPAPSPPAVAVLLEHNYCRRREATAAVYLPVPSGASAGLQL